MPYFLLAMRALQWRQHSFFTKSENMFLFETHPYYAIYEKLIALLGNQKVVSRKVVSTLNGCFRDRQAIYRKFPGPGCSKRGYMYDVIIRIKFILLFFLVMKHYNRLVVNLASPTGVRTSINGTKCFNVGMVRYASSGDTQGGVTNLGTN